MKMKEILAVGLFCCATPVLAATCEATVDGNDAMQFNVKEITVDKSCEKFTVTLTHSGKLAKNVMGHNWVLVKTPDVKAVATDGATAGLANDYLKAGDARVIAHTKLIGAGETDSVTFDVSKLEAGGDYTYFCSFPGHWGVMKGVLKF